MPRYSNAPTQPNHRTNGEKHRGTGSRKENVRSGYHESLDEIEYLRAGGKTIPDRPDLESMSTPGTFRTYSHNDEQDGDNDFDSSYGDDQKAYSDRGAEDRFLRGKDEASDYSSVSDHGTGRIGKIEKETADPLPSSKNDHEKK
jgi:hypothetical protein